jgi:sensor c-di-GMP phosphodiesterase-like protein
MRNRTFIKLLIAVAVLAGILPVALFLGLAFRQSATRIQDELTSLSEGVAARVERVLDSSKQTLQLLARETDGRTPEEAVRALDVAVLANLHLERAALVEDGRIICTNQGVVNEPVELSISAGTPPPPGELRLMLPDSASGLEQSLYLFYSIDSHRAVEVWLDPTLLSEFWEDMALRNEMTVFVLLDGGPVIASLGRPDAALPAGYDSSASHVQRLPGILASVRKLGSYPVTVVSSAPMSIILAHWGSSVFPFLAAGILLSALLVYLVLKLAKRTRSMESDLREAVRFEEIDVHYQPVMELATGRCVGAEALMRWRHPERGFVPAAEFIDIAEQSRLVVEMTDKMMAKIARDLRGVFKNHPEMHIGINLAAQHFENEHIVEATKAIFGGKIDPRQIIYEITERGFINEENSPARHVMNALRERGSAFAVDDFGTGYSSLSYLQRLDLDYLKIDKAFVDGIESEDYSSGLVDPIIQIAKSLNLKTIAEGVEHEYQALYLKKRGVDYAQGWFFAKPIPAKDFIDFVAYRELPDRVSAAAPSIVD